MRLILKVICLLQITSGEMHFLMMVYKTPKHVGKNKWLYLIYFKLFFIVCM